LGEVALDDVEGHADAVVADPEKLNAFVLAPGQGSGEFLFGTLVFEEAGAGVDAVDGLERLFALVP
jgi:hypothetical protein